MLLAAAERRLGLADRLATMIRDPRAPGRVTNESWPTLFWSMAQPLVVFK